MKKTKIIKIMETKKPVLYVYFIYYEGNKKTGFQMEKIREYNVDFLDWAENIRIKKEIELDCPIVITNCSIIKQP